MVRHGRASGRSQRPEEEGGGWVRIRGGDGRVIVAILPVAAPDCCQLTTLAQDMGITYHRHMDWPYIGHSSVAWMRTKGPLK